MSAYEIVFRARLKSRWKRAPRIEYYGDQASSRLTLTTSIPYAEGGVNENILWKVVRSKGSKIAPTYSKVCLT